MEPQSKCGDIKMRGENNKYIFSLLFLPKLLTSFRHEIFSFTFLFLYTIDITLFLINKFICLNFQIPSHIGIFLHGLIGLCKLFCNPKQKSCTVFIWAWKVIQGYCVSFLNSGYIHQGVCSFCIKHKGSYVSSHPPIV